VSTHSSYTTATCPHAGEAAQSEGLRRGRLQGRAGPSLSGPGDDAGASNAWFPILLSGALDPAKLEFAQATRDDRWGDLYDIEGEGDIASCAVATSCGISQITRTPTLGGDPGAAGGWRGGAGEDVADLKTRVGDLHRPRARPEDEGLPLKEVRRPSPFAEYFERVVLVSECVMCGRLIGFTRIESQVTYESPRISPRLSE